MKRNLWFILLLQIATSYLVNATLTVDNVSEDCSYVNSQMTIKGSHVKFSDFLDHDGKLKGCEFPVNSVLVYSQDKVIIDQDLNATGHELQISVFAPKWEVIGKKHITLDGAEGKPHEPLGNNSFGEAGRPGRPGGPGGNFFGIGKEFINESGLTISVRGGKGGPGQNGGIGKDGKNGTSPFLAEQFPTCDREFCKHDWLVTYADPGGKTFDNFTCKSDRSRLVNEPYGKRMRGLGHGNTNRSGPRRCRTLLIGKEGQPGEPGGDGGRGGLGGNPGHVIIIGLNNYHSKVSVFNETGLEGQPGTGGVGGNSGKKGRNRAYVYSFGDKEPQWLLQHGTQFPGVPVKNGEKGRDGANSVNLEEPRNAAGLSSSSYILGYKHYLTTQAESGSNSDSRTTQFSQELDEDEEVKKYLSS